MVILLGLIILAFFIQYDILKTFILDKVPLQKLILLLAIGLVLFMVFILIYLYSKLKFILQLKKKISGLKEGILSILHMEKKWSSGILKLNLKEYAAIQEKITARTS